MKMTRYFLGLLMLLSFGGQADTYVGDLHTYFGAGNPALTNFTTLSGSGDAARNVLWDIPGAKLAFEYRGYNKHLLE